MSKGSVFRWRHIFLVATNYEYLSLLFLNLLSSPHFKKILDLNSKNLRKLFTLQEIFFSFWIYAFKVVSIFWYFLQYIFCKFENLKIAYFPTLQIKENYFARFSKLVSEKISSIFTFNKTNLFSSCSNKQFNNYILQMISNQ